MTAKKNTGEKAIILQPWEVKAFLAGVKTQLRRPLTPPPIRSFPSNVWVLPGSAHALTSGDKPSSFCPLGGVGSRLWCREKWGVPQGLKPKEAAYYASYAADETTWYSHTETPYPKSKGPGFVAPASWCTPIMLPRHLSRILLEITDVTVQRLGEISYQDTIAEGFPEGPTSCGPCELHCCDTHPEWGYDAFAAAWDATYKKKPGFAWDASPWVWRLIVRRLP